MDKTAAIPPPTKPPETPRRLQSLVSERSLRTARLASGLVMMAFVIMHLGNLSLSLISLEAAEAGRLWFLAIWRSLAGTVVLYVALLTHVALVLRSLYRRRSLIMPLREAAQVLAGLAIPLLVAQHVIGTRVFHELTGVPDTYEFVVRALWITSPGVGLTQAIALVVVWAHGCLGLHFWLRYRAWYPAAAPWFLIAAVLVPVVSLLAFAHAGQLVALMERQPLPDSVDQSLIPGALDTAYALIDATYVFFGALVAGLFALQNPAPPPRAQNLVEIRYESGQTVRVPRGHSVLEASRIAGIPHYSVCGGRGRCSTCRVRVTSGQDDQPLAGPVEELTLTRIHAGPDVRLACQFRPVHDLTVMPLLAAGQERALPIGSRQAAPGREQEIAVLFCDIRSFTALADHRLPYDIVFLLNRYFAVVGKAVEQSGGRLDKFIGDGAMALFGLGTTQGRGLPPGARRLGRHHRRPCAAERGTGRRHTGAAEGRHRHPCRTGDRRRHGLWRRDGGDGDRRHGQHRQPAGIGGQGVRRRDRHFRRRGKPVGHRHVGFRDARDRHPRQHPPAPDPPRAGRRGVHGTGDPGRDGGLRQVRASRGTGRPACRSCAGGP